MPPTPGVETLGFTPVSGRRKEIVCACAGWLPIAIPTAISINSRLKPRCRTIATSWAGVFCEYYTAEAAATRFRNLPTPDMAGFAVVNDPFISRYVQAI